MLSYGPAQQLIGCLPVSSGLELTQFDIYKEASAQHDADLEISLVGLLVPCAQFQMSACCNAFMTSHCSLYVVSCTMP